MKEFVSSRAGRLGQTKRAGGRKGGFSEGTKKDDPLIIQPASSPHPSLLLAGLVFHNLGVGQV